MTSASKSKLLRSGFWRGRARDALANARRLAGTATKIIAERECSGDRAAAEIERLEHELGRLERELARRDHELEELDSTLRMARHQLVSQAKMVLLGQLVAGVAHELNNPANFIYGSSVALSERIEKLAGQIDDDSFEDLKRLIAVLRTGGERIRDLTNNLRSFSRSNDTERSVFRLKDAVDSTWGLLEPRARKRGVTLAADVPDDLEARGHQGEICQVLMNLLTNAVQASDQGTVVEVAAKLEGDELSVSVSDDGPGVSESARGRLFEPFFTTKDHGDGTGLGLTLSDTIARSHGGRIEVENNEVRGATFRLVIPALNSGGCKHG